MDQAIDALTEQASTCAALLDDVLQPTRLTKEETFRFFRRLCNYADWKSVSNSHSYGHSDSPGHCYTYSASYGYTDS